MTTTDPALRVHILPEQAVAREVLPPEDIRPETEPALGEAALDLMTAEEREAALDIALADILAPVAPPPGAKSQRLIGGGNYKYLAARGISTLRDARVVGLYELIDMRLVGQKSIDRIAAAIATNLPGEEWHNDPPIELVVQLCPTIHQVTAAVLGVSVERLTIGEILSATPKELKERLGYLSPNMLSIVEAAHAYAQRFEAARLATSYY